MSLSANSRAGCGCALCRQSLPAAEPVAQDSTWLFANLQRAYESARKHWREQNNIPLGGWRQ